MKLSGFAIEAAEAGVVWWVAQQGGCASFAAAGAASERARLSNAG